MVMLKSSQVDVTELRIAGFLHAQPASGDLGRRGSAVLHNGGDRGLLQDAFRTRMDPALPCFGGAIRATTQKSGSDNVGYLIVRWSIVFGNICEFCRLSDALLRFQLHSTHIG